MMKTCHGVLIVQSGVFCVCLIGSTVSYHNRGKEKVEIGGNATEHGETIALPSILLEENEEQYFPTAEKQTTTTSMSNQMVVGSDTQTEVLQETEEEESAGDGKGPEKAERKRNSSDTKNFTMEGEEVSTDMIEGEEELSVSSDAKNSQTTGGSFSEATHPNLEEINDVPSTRESPSRSPTKGTRHMEILSDAPSTTTTVEGISRGNQRLDEKQEGTNDSSGERGKEEQHPIVPEGLQKETARETDASDLIAAEVSNEQLSKNASPQTQETTLEGTAQVGPIILEEDPTEEENIREDDFMEKDSALEDSITTQKSPTETIATVEETSIEVGGSVEDPPDGAEDDVTERSAVADEVEKESPIAPIPIADEVDVENPIPDEVEKGSPITDAVEVENPITDEKENPIAEDVTEENHMEEEVTSATEESPSPTADAVTRGSPTAEASIEMETTESSFIAEDTTQNSSIAGATTQAIPQGTTKYITPESTQQESSTSDSTTQLSPNPTTQLSPNPTTQRSSNPTTQLSPNPTTQLSPNPTTQLSPNPTTQLSPNPTTQLSPNPTIQLSPNPTTTEREQQPSENSQTSYARTTTGGPRYWWLEGDAQGTSVFKPTTREPLYWWIEHPAIPSGTRLFPTPVTPSYVPVTETSHMAPDIFRKHYNYLASATGTRLTPTSVPTTRPDNFRYNYNWNSAGSDFCQNPQCSMEVNPVCGSDGVTYRNACCLLTTQCRKPHLRQRYAGECRQEAWRRGFHRPQNPSQWFSSGRSRILRKEVGNETGQ